MAFDRLDLEVAAELLRDAAEVFSNHGCNDFTLPESWTQEQRGQFTLRVSRWNGDPEGLAVDWCVMEYLASVLDPRPAGRDSGE